MNINEYMNINFEEVLFPRYVKVKESIEDLMKLIEFDKVKNDGIDRVLHAFLQLIDENDDKTVEEKREVIEDAIYNGNVFRHYFNEENQAKAVEILSNTVILNDKERLIYIINFFMPNDINFTNVYNSFEKDIEKIAEHYNLSQQDADKLIYARATEIAKFHDIYKAEKDRQRRFNETQALAAMQDATDEPSKENIDKVKELLGGLTNNNLKDTLGQQLLELENDNINPGDLNIEELIPEEELELGTSEVDMHSINDIELDSEEKIPVDATLEVKEPELLENVLEEYNKTQEMPTQEGVKEEVMESLQNLVANAKENAIKVEQLSLDLDVKNEQIANLNATLEEKNQEIVNKSQELAVKTVELQEKDKMIQERDARIQTLEEELGTNKNQLEEVRKTIETKDNEIATLSRGLHAHQEYLVEIQNFLSKAQTGMTTSVTQEDARKVK